ncbi:MAG: class I SAM-dependent methyltransferase [Planctomycetes bacterium]|nr:class I SAM-dependent methyltransferase [Planctomycetota bacterium]
MTGVDLNAELLWAACEHVPGGRLVVSFADALPVAGGSFDGSS